MFTLEKSPRARVAPDMRWILDDLRDYVRDQLAARVTAECETTVRTHDPSETVWITIKRYDSSDPDVPNAVTMYLPLYFTRVQIESALDSIPQWAANV